MNELNSVIKKVDEAFTRFDFNSAAKSLRDFMWTTYASNYVEMVKKRAYAGDESSRWALHESFKKLLLLLAPIIPVITEKIYQEMYEKDSSIHEQSFPESGEEGLSSLTPKILDFNSMVWAKKKELNKSLKDGIKIEIPSELEGFSQDLINMHNISQ